MKTSERFAEYGLIGGFFWLTQVLLSLVWFGGVPPENWLLVTQHLNVLVNPIPSALQASLAGLLGALALIGIFFTGLVIDLFESPLVLNEVAIFREFVATNRSWLKKLAEKDRNLKKDYIQVYFRGGAFDRLLRILRNSDRPSISKLCGMFRHAFGDVKFLGPSRKLEAAILAYVAINGGNARLDILFDQINLWRTSRAVSTAVALLAFEFAIVTLMMESGPTMLTAAIFLVLLVVSLNMTQRAYSRMCTTLFSFAYTTHERLIFEASSPKHEAD